MVKTVFDDFETKAVKKWEGPSNTETVIRINDSHFETHPDLMKALNHFMIYTINLKDEEGLRICIDAIVSKEEVK